MKTEVWNKFLFFFFLIITYSQFLILSCLFDLYSTIHNILLIYGVIFMNHYFICNMMLFDGFYVDKFKYLNQVNK